MIQSLALERKTMKDAEWRDPEMIRQLNGSLPTVAELRSGGRWKDESNNEKEGCFIVVTPTSMLVIPG